MHDGVLYVPIQGQGHVALKYYHFQNLTPPFSVGAGK